MTVLPQCVACKHFESGVLSREVCAAFPRGIPQEILLNEVDHRVPVDGDHGIRFEAKKGRKHPLADAEVPEMLPAE